MQVQSYMNHGGPRVGVAGVIFSADLTQIVLIQRGAEPAKGLWSFPGGMVEPGESPLAACAREVLEETHLRVELEDDPVVLLDRVIRHHDGRVLYHFVIMDFLASVTGGTLRAGSDAADARWVDLKDLATLPTTEALSYAVRRAHTIARGDTPLDPQLLRVDGMQ